MIVHLAEQRSLRAPESRLQRDKEQVAHSFSRAAASYDSVAALQRRIGHQLLAYAAGGWHGRVLDLGSGTGYFTRILAEQPQVNELIALDLAEGMLDFARTQRGHDKIHWLCADAEALPLADNSLDGVFTSLAIQWCDDSEPLLDGLQQSLKPGALLAFATLGPRTLWELRDAWSRVDDFVHVNGFESRHRLKAALAGRFELERFDTEEICLRYEDLRGLTDELKGIGAHNVNPGRNRGLSGRQRIKAFRDAYEGFRGDDGLLPATYEVYYGLARAL
ncbi:malonyl-ACP O-methyltransferase BioC [Motiliproteus sediminis]|uniref:malonyl-ACP O-methyltransferase BioC n=1 Tax=Motiliproteus sediminis TaxID=1468178 RepID=UPI001AEFEC03|nr:malonyl-ACP O-methyltransferase BioC [Motiliproteus sediminis]